LTSYTIKEDTFHYLWSNSHKPALHVKPGDQVTFHVNESTSGQISKESTATIISNLDLAKAYPLAGPVYVEGASPGDALSITVQSVKVADWGWSAIMPPLGLLEEFNEPYLFIWNLRDKKEADFKKGIKIPLRPFCGVMGVAPAEEGFFSVLPPGKHGGNMDIRNLVEGSRLDLPVLRQGALFSVADMHAAQGDGEVCVSAIECSGETTVIFDIIKHAKIESPRYYVSKDDARFSAGYFSTTGIAPDLMIAAKKAVREMIALLCSQYGLTAEEAYILCSVAADLRIHEIVSRPNWIVGLAIPRAIFGNSADSGER